MKKPIIKTIISHNNDLIGLDATSRPYIWVNAEWKPYVNVRDDVPAGTVKELLEPGAHEILGKDYISSAAVADALRITSLDYFLAASAPPLSYEELKAAKAAGQMLIYRVPGLTMRDIVEKTRHHFKNGDKLLWNTDWYKDEAFYTQEVTRGGWALVSKEVVPGTNKKTHAEQTAIVGDNRRRACEALYDLAVYYAVNGERLLNGWVYDWTSSRSSDGKFVYVGGFEAGGVRVSSRDPGLRDDLLGASLSRSL